MSPMAFLLVKVIGNSNVIHVLATHIDLLKNTCSLVSSPPPSTPSAPKSRSVIKKSMSPGTSPGINILICILDFSVASTVGFAN